MSEPAHITDATRWDSDKAKRIAFRSRFPTTEQLEQGLLTVLQPSVGPVTLLAREPNVYRSTFPSEVVRCGTADGSAITLLCKYGLSHKHDAFGHRGGATYEGLVYRHVLSPLRARPRFFGTYVPVASEFGEEWLLLEYIEDALRLDRAEPSPSPLALAAEWIGGFHAAVERCHNDEYPTFLNAYDEKYVVNWARRTLTFSHDLLPQYPWLEGLCHAFVESATDVLSARHTIIHGEFTPHNVVVREAEAFPVDWESAAVAPGEIDLVSLCEGWPESDVAEAEASYIAARWPAGEPASFLRDLAGARLYWSFRWLGERLDWTTSQRSVGRFERLREIGRTLGLTP